MKPANPPERIQNWQHSQLSIARHYGGITYQGHGYQIAYDEPGQPLVRADVLRSETRERQAQAKAAKQAAKQAQGDLI